LVREALVSLRAATQLLSRVADKLPEVSASAKAVEILGAAEAAPGQPSEAVLDAIAARLVAAFERPGSLMPTRSDLRDAPWLLWANKRPLANLPGLLDAIWTQATRSNVTQRNLIEAWLQSFSLDGLRIAEGGEGIRNLLALNPNARFDFWRNVDRRVELFAARAGPGRLARWLLQGPESVPDVLRAAGFDDPLRAAGGYMRSVQREALALIANALRGQSSREALTRLTSFLAPESALRFSEPQSCGEIADGLLAPWLDNSWTPIDSARDSVRKFLLRYIGDPRVRPANWRMARKDTTSLMRRWLTRASLKAFFDLISDHVLDSQWRYREAFWSACVDKEPATEAWLALGSQVHASARAVRELNGAYARLEGAGILGSHAVLLLRMGNIVFCEWSHNGKLRAWPEDWKSAPRLYLPSYARDALMGPGLPFPPNRAFGSRGTKDGSGLRHIGPDRNYWQGSAAELLSRRTGIRLSASDWKPQ
jgi:hypothetical protein